MNAVKGFFIQIDQDQQMSAAVRRSPGQRQAVFVSGMNQFKPGSGMKRRMDFQQRLQAAEKVYLVVFLAPVYRFRVMDVNFRVRKPFHSVGKAECPVLGEQRAKGVAHHGIFFGARRQSAVVMSF